MYSKQNIHNSSWRQVTTLSNPFPAGLAKRYGTLFYNTNPRNEWHPLYYYIALGNSRTRPYLLSSTQSKLFFRLFPPFKSNWVLILMNTDTIESLKNTKDINAGVGIFFSPTAINVSLYRYISTDSYALYIFFMFYIYIFQLVDIVPQSPSCRIKSELALLVFNPRVLFFSSFSFLLGHQRDSLGRFDFSFILSPETGHWSASWWVLDSKRNFRLYTFIYFCFWREIGDLSFENFVSKGVWFSRKNNAWGRLIQNVFIAFKCDLNFRYL